MILSIIWLFFSLPWLMLVMLMSPMAFDSPHSTEGSNWIPIVEYLVGYAVTPPLVFGGVLLFIKSLSKGGLAVNAVLFLGILRVLLWILGGALGASHILSRNPNLCENADATWIGVNLLPLCCVAFTAAWGLGFWASKGEPDSEPRKNFVGFLRLILIPFVWTWGCIKEAIYGTPAVKP